MGAVDQGRMHLHECVRLEAAVACRRRIAADDGVRDLETASERVARWKRHKRRNGTKTKQSKTKQMKSNGECRRRGGEHVAAARKEGRQCFKQKRFIRSVGDFYEGQWRNVHWWNIVTRHTSGDMRATLRLRSNSSTGASVHAVQIRAIGLAVTALGKKTT